MNDTFPTLKLLDELEHFNWGEYKEWLDCKDVDTEDCVESYGSRTSLSRQTSNLVRRNYSSGLESNTLSVDSRRYAPDDLRLRLTRLTSSPTIRYNKAIPRGETEGMPNQLRAKHIKLIESFSNIDRSIERFEQSRSGGSHQIQRQQSLEQKRDQQRPLERPNKLFGPLRSENAGDEWRMSEEPMSLPYDLNNYNLGKSRWQQKQQQQPHQADHYDDFLDSSPIRRINSTEKATNDKLKRESTSVGNPDDDEFDITNLLSITVLSDIKTIRQDLSSSGRQLSSLTAKQLPKSRQKKSAMVPKMPGRARSAIDFDYSNRHINNHYHYNEEYNLSHPQSVQSQRYHTDEHVSSSGNNSVTGPYSLVGHQSTDYPSKQKVALRGTLSATTSGTTKAKPEDMERQVDEKQAQIIEIFKAQVKARAKQTIPTKIDENSQLPVKQPQQEQQNPTQSTVVASEASTGNSAPPRRIVAELKLSSGSESIEEAKPGERVEGGSGPQTALSDKVQKANVASVETEPAMAGASTSILTTPASADASVDISKNKVKVLSNIPVLVSLHKSKFTPSLELPSSSSKSTEGTIVSQAANPKVSGIVRAPLSKVASVGVSSKKFVSQYKRLRGKSLADEVEEQSK